MSKSIDLTQLFCSARGRSVAIKMSEEEMKGGGKNERGRKDGGGSERKKKNEGCEDLVG